MYGIYVLELESTSFLKERSLLTVTKRERERGWLNE